MKFNKILNDLMLESGGRTKSISKEKAQKLVKNNSSFEHNGVYRGNSEIGGNFGFIKPRKYTRQSRNTANYYTLVMDNTDMWNAYPNRSQSIICTTDKSMAQSYGACFKVYSFTGYKMGVAPRGDIWESFKEVENALGGYSTLKELNDTISAMWTRMSPNRLSQKNFKKFKKQLESVTLREIGDWSWPGTAEKLVNFWKRETTYDNLFQLFKGILDPDFNMFRSIDTTERIPGRKGKEVWTDAPSVLVHETASL